MDDRIRFNNIINSLYLGPAILHADRFYRKELCNGSLPKHNREIFDILYTHYLLEEDGKLTELGNQIFSCIDLIQYYVDTGEEMAIHKKPKKQAWMYDTLRKGLGQQICLNAIEYIDFIKEFVTEPHTIIDIGGGDGTYLFTIGEHYGIGKGFLIDKDVDTANALIKSIEVSPTVYKTIKQDLLQYIDISPHRADLVLLNEVLHLGDDSWWALMIEQALRCSKPNAQICIGEVIPTAVFDWRMKAYTDRGRSFNYDEFVHWLGSNYGSSFKEDFNMLETDTHWYVLLTRST